MYNPHLGRSGANMIAVPLVATDQRIIGQVWVWLEARRLHARVMPASDWQLERLQVTVAKTAQELPTSASGCPEVDQFPWTHALNPPLDHHELTVDLANVGLAEVDQIVLAAHADLQSWTNGHAQAWADGPSVTGCSDTANYVQVDLRGLRGLILWNKLGSAHEVTHSEVGPDGVVVGDVSWFRAQHGDGFRPEPRAGNHNIPDNYISFSGLQLGARGCIEFWYQPDWEDAAIGHVVDILSYGIPDDPYNTHVAMTFNDRQNRLNNGALDASTIASVFVHEVATIPGWSMTKPVHMALSWNGDAPRPSDRLAVFVNGVALPSTAWYGDPRLHDWHPEAVLRLGSRLVSGDWQRHHWEGLDGVIDNIKIWDFPKAEFNDRFAE
ncbi:hypothetical protein DB30_00061 [Enhygromyxa salina]|uniref:Uncharacterized protein n=1 Tax=Enhygromyxa salina TaxID=215803 RepID=A0A0C2DIP6_9BACT|nr:hypothetical protein [Enhygromyxa salina]KIG19552.1 hypothetical protein DB30_00061 [Enhygromyxa salina]